MGATYYQIIFLLLKEILVLIGIAILFAWTTAYVFSRFWLKDFYTRIRLTPNYFFEAALIVIVLSILVVLYQCYNAAREEPSTALKTE
jgi:ABC-type antimicrobial peptide transport system permease subunit